MSEENNDKLKKDTMSKLDTNESTKLDVDISDMQPHLATSLKEISQIVQSVVPETFRVQQKLINKMTVSKGLNDVALASIRAVNSELKLQAKAINLAIDPLIELKNHLHSTITPIIEYAEQNQDKFKNYEKSLYRLVDKFKDQYDISENDAMDLIEKLVEDNKIIINEEWKFVVVDNSLITNDDKSILNEILKWINLLFGIFQIIDGSEYSIDVNYSTTNIEYINQEITQNIVQTYQDENEYRIINNTLLYKRNDEDSEILAELKVDDSATIVSVEDQWVFIIVMGENRELQHSGWIALDDIDITN